ncbi:hypothetical protein ACLB2K_002488 [Fragaria x ananassa]
MRPDLVEIEFKGAQLCSLIPDEFLRQRRQRTSSFVFELLSMFFRQVATKAAAGDVWRFFMLSFGKEELLVVEVEQMEVGGSVQGVFRALDSLGLTCGLLF